MLTGYGHQSLGVSVRYWKRIVVKVLLFNLKLHYFFFKRSLTSPGPPSAGSLISSAAKRIQGHKDLSECEICDDLKGKGEW